MRSALAKLAEELEVGAAFAWENQSGAPAL